MSVTDRLTAALDERAAGARLAPDALDRIRSRARLHRRNTRLRIAGGVTAFATVAALIPLLRTDPAPAGPTGNRGMTSGFDKFGAITADRELVIVSTVTGEILGTVATFDRMPTSIDLDYPGWHALVVLPPKTAGGCGSVVEFDLVRHTRRTVTKGNWAQYEGSSWMSIMVTECSGKAIKFVRVGEPAGPIPYSRDPRDTGRIGAVLGDTLPTDQPNHLYVLEAGGTTNWLYRVHVPLARHRSVVESERVLLVDPATMNVPVPWTNSRLLHTSPTSGEVRVGLSYRDGRIESSQLLFTVPHPVDELTIVGGRNDILVSAGGRFWLWKGKGAPVDVGPAYPLFD